MKEREIGCGDVDDVREKLPIDFAGLASGTGTAVPPLRWVLPEMCNRAQ